MPELAEHRLSHRLEINDLPPDVYTCLSYGVEGNAPLPGEEPLVRGVTIAITRTEEADHGAYRAELPGADRPAELTWHALGPLRVADHTFVPPAMRGRGVAQVLVEALVADARQLGFKIVPQCSYVAAQFRRHPEWSDLLATPDN